MFGVVKDLDRGRLLSHWDITAGPAPGFVDRVGLEY